MRHLYFVRHGQAEANLAAIFAGHLDSPLTDLGKSQAKSAGIKAQKLHIEHIVSSPLSRAHETAVIIAHEIDYPVDNIVVNNLFLERDYGSLQGKPWTAEWDLNGPGVETMDMLLKRGQRAYTYLKLLPQDTVLVVSHGSFWRALRAAIDPQTPLTEGDEPANAEIIQLI